MSAPVEVQPRDTEAAVMLLLKASRLSRYTVQAMGERWPVVSRYEVIRCRDGEMHAIVQVSHSGTLRITYVNPEATILGEEQPPTADDEQFARELEQAT